MAGSDRPARGVAWRSALSGGLAGVALTLAVLYALGVPLDPGLNSPAFQKFVVAYKDLTQRYYKPLSSQNLLNGAIAGMVNATGDPFTDYFDPSQAQQFENQLSGEFDGIGVVIRQQGGRLSVLQVIPGSPAEKAGIRAGDVIVAVGGKSVAGVPIDQVSQMILGRAGTTVSITVERLVADKPKDYTLKVTRGPVTAPSVYWRMLDGSPYRVGYLQISVIGEHTASEVDAALAKLKQAGAQRVIIDLRGNGGGYLEQAVQIAGAFLPRGKLVVQTEDRGGHRQQMVSQGPGTDLPLVVLVDQDTASAAEILAAALHDDAGAPLVGTKTFGKGTVQETDTYRDGSALKYTVARWLTPTGEWINGKGLTPTVQVALPPIYTLPAMDPSKLPLREGDNNDTVQALQEALAAVGDAPDRQDGYYDAGTSQVVRRLQAKHGLAQTGVFDKATYDALMADIEAKLETSDTQLQRALQEAEKLPAHG
ncbi:MAG: S41 family peptidase [Thermoflavifilum sp.]|nr:S41 family peptidase [Thermoflavifilum sp.]MCL6514151.1 S41 family peptidase [Alicyclobacillus sp.]